MNSYPKNYFLAVFDKSDKPLIIFGINYRNLDFAIKSVKFYVQREHRFCAGDQMSTGLRGIRDRTVFLSLLPGAVFVTRD
jgi:hypothetical protein